MCPPSSLFALYGREVRVFGGGPGDLLAPVLGVVAEGADHRAEDGDDAERPEHRLPELDEQRNAWIGRQVVPLRVVAVGEDRDDSRPADAPRVVERGLLEAVCLQLGDSPGA